MKIEDLDVVRDYTFPQVVKHIEALIVIIIFISILPAIIEYLRERAALKKAENKK